LRGAGIRRYGHDGRHVPAHGEPLQAESGAIKQAVVRSIQLGRQGRPADIAAAIAFFASDDAGWITGQTLNVNGGTPMD